MNRSLAAIQQLSGRCNLFTSDRYHTYARSQLIRGDSPTGEPSAAISLCFFDLGWLGFSPMMSHPAPNIDSSK